MLQHRPVFGSARGLVCPQTDPGIQRGVAGGQAEYRSHEIPQRGCPQSCAKWGVGETWESGSREESGSRRESLSRASRRESGSREDLTPPELGGDVLQDALDHVRVVVDA